MRDGHRFVDVDMHISEPIDVFERHMDPAFKGRITVPWKKGDNLLDRILVDGKPSSRAVPRDFRMIWPKQENPLLKALTAQRERCRFATERGWDAESQLMAMEMEGIDIAVLFPSSGLFILQPDMEPQFALAVCQAYNNWIHEYCQHSPAQLKWVAMLPWQDVNLASRELERCVKLGARGSYLRPNAVPGRPNWSSFYWYPLYELHEHLNVPWCFHEGTGWYSEIETRLGEEWVLRHILSHWVEAQIAMATQMVGGVFEYFPKLQVAYMESQASWVPGLLNRIEDNYRGFHERFYCAHMSLTPSEYFHRNCWVTIEGEEPELDAILGLIGSDRVCISTDYPHYDSHFPDVSRELLRDCPKHGPAILGNAARLYNFTDDDFKQAAAAEAKRLQHNGVTAART